MQMRSMHCTFGTCSIDKEKSLVLELSILHLLHDQICGGQVMGNTTSALSPYFTKPISRANDEGHSGHRILVLADSCSAVILCYSANAWSCPPLFLMLQGIVNLILSHPRSLRQPTKSTLYPLALQNLH